MTTLRLLRTNVTSCVPALSPATPLYRPTTISHNFRAIGILIPPGIGEPTRTVSEVFKYIKEHVIGGPRTYDPSINFEEARTHQLMATYPKHQDELPVRKMQDSFDQAIIPLEKDSTLRDRYLTTAGGVRIGRLLEDMDIFAVHLAFLHVLNPLQDPNDPRCPFSIVTVLVDRIHVKQAIKPDRNIKFAGHITWVGRSSTEATLSIYQHDAHGHWIEIVEAHFVFAARDPLNHGPVCLNRLVADTPEEKAVLELGKIRNIQRRKTANESLFKNPPSENEMHLIHDFFTTTIDHSCSHIVRVKPANSVWMEETKLKSIVICQPENRNCFNKIFGGFIMRQAFELAWTCAYVYSAKPPTIVYMDDISFDKPVEIGALLYFTSQVCFNKHNFIQVRVSAEIMQPHIGKADISNVFHYTFAINVASHSRTLRTVIPKTYQEAMIHLDGRRHFLDSLCGPDDL